MKATLRELFSTALWHLATPYRAGREFIDTHPSAETIKHHLQSVEPKVVTVSQEKLNVVLAYPEAKDAPPRMLREIEINVPGEHATDRANEYAQGIVDGWTLCREEILKLRRSEAEAQQAFIKEHQPVIVDLDVMPALAPEFV